MIKSSFARKVEPMYYDAVSESVLPPPPNLEQYNLYNLKKNASEHEDSIKYIDETTQAKEKVKYSKSLFFLKDDTELLLSMLAGMVPSTPLSKFLLRVEANKASLHLLARFEKQIQVDSYTGSSIYVGDTPPTHIVRKKIRGHLYMLVISFDATNSRMGESAKKTLLKNVLNSIMKLNGAVDLSGEGKHVSLDWYANFGSYDTQSPPPWSNVDLSLRECLRLFSSFTCGSAYDTKHYTPPILEYMLEPVQDAVYFPYPQINVNNDSFTAVHIQFFEFKSLLDEFESALADSHCYNLIPAEHMQNIASAKIDVSQFAEKLREYIKYRRGKRFHSNVEDNFLYENLKVKNAKWLTFWLSKIVNEIRYYMEMGNRVNVLTNDTVHKHIKPLANSVYFVTGSDLRRTSSDNELYHATFNEFKTLVNRNTSSSMHYYIIDLDICSEVSTTFNRSITLIRGPQVADRDWDANNSQKSPSNSFNGSTMSYELANKQQYQHYQQTKGESREQETKTTRNDKRSPSALDKKEPLSETRVVRSAQKVDSEPKSEAANVSTKSGDEKRQQINLILLGESGIGKSTFVNALYNYVKSSSLEEAAKIEVCPHLIASNISYTDEKYKNYNVQIGEDANECNVSGQSSTQNAQAHRIELDDKTVINVIDTPGIHIHLYQYL